MDELANLSMIELFDLSYRFSNILNEVFLSCRGPGEGYPKVVPSSWAAIGKSYK